MKATDNSVIKRVREHIAKNGMLATDDKVLCALSGGADSVALLLILKALEAELGITVFAAHLNHGIRGVEADRDESFCSELCRSLGVPFVSERANVPAVAKIRKNGLEEAAREVRYEFLNRACSSLGCNKIATAHHADDNIETVLLHMLRGCALGGLKGISAVRGNIIRPLLTVRKKELEQLLEEQKCSFVYDSTNDELDCTRNYIRHKILPCIYGVNESADKVFYRMCKALAKDAEYLESEAEKIPDNAKAKELALYHEALLARYIKSKYEKKTGKTALDSASVDSIVSAVKKGETVKYSVQGDVTVYVSASGIDFVKNSENTKAEGVFALDWGENLILPIGYRILITKDKNVAESFINIYKTSICTKVNGDKITNGDSLAVTVRTRMSGDAYTFGKMKRDVRRQLINFKIPVQKRDNLPVFCINGEIFHVHGLKLADGYEAKGADGVIYIAVSEI